MLAAAIAAPLSPTPPEVSTHRFRMTPVRPQILAGHTVVTKPSIAVLANQYGSVVVRTTSSVHSVTGQV